VFVGQRRKKVYYILRYNKEHSHERNDFLELEYETSNGLRQEGEDVNVKVQSELKRLEEKILMAKGRKRDKAIETYRELLRLVRDEPIYLLRYE
jgi:hypothetical protein